MGIVGGYQLRVARLSVMLRKRVAAAWVGLVMLTLGGLLSCYYLAFSVWMMAYPMADPEFWRPRFYERLGITFLIGFLWTVVSIWLFKHRKVRE
jgi:hypothetical protein